MVLIKAVLQTAVEAHKSGSCFSVVKVAVIGFSKKENKWLSKLKHNHPLFILSPCLSHTAYCKRTSNVQISWQRGAWREFRWRAAPERSVRLLNIKKVSAHKRKETELQYRNLRNKRCWLLFLFLHYFTRKTAPLLQTQGTIQLFLYTWRSKVQQGTLLLWSRMTATFIHSFSLHDDCTFEDMKYEKRTEMKSDHHYTAKCHF